MVGSVESCKLFFYEKKNYDIQDNLPNATKGNKYKNLLVVLVFVPLCYVGSVLGVKSHEISGGHVPVDVVDFIFVFVYIVVVIRRILF